MKLIKSVLPAVALAGITLLCTTVPAKADGMQPETTIVVIHEEDGEATMSVKNSDPMSALLHTTIHDIPEDTESVVVVTPPIARVEAGQSQLVRFIYQGEPLATQRMKRVSFDTIKQSRKGEEGSSVGVSVRQNLPILLHPKGLPRNEKPWELLAWSLQGDQLSVTNVSAYVVRLAQEVHVMPSDAMGTLPRTYLLPGERFTTTVAGAGNDDRVRLQPASVYGFTVKEHIAPLK